MNIDQIVEKIISVVQPSRIYLFGSRARGDSNPDSDYDLLILMPETTKISGREIKSIVREALWNLMEPLDLLVYTESEFKLWQDSIHHVLGHAAREGRLIYG